MPAYSEILFGQVVLKNRLATYAQVSECLARLGGRSLGEVLVERGLIGAEQAKQAQRAQALMQFMRAERILARILVERRLVDADTVRKAFAVQEQQNYRVRIAQVLVERRLVAPAQIEEAVDEQLVRLADETARIEELGLEGLLREPQPRDEPFAAAAPFDPASELESSRLKKAQGPRGLLDAQPVRRTTPLRPAVSEAELEGYKRTMEVDSASFAVAADAAPLSDDELIGKTIASRYRILEKVGEGGMGTVYRAEHCLMEKVVALKVLNPSLVSSKASLERFRREIRATSRFQHKHVIQIYDAGEGEGGLFYMAMEFAEGETLEEMLARERPMDVERALELYKQVLRAVGEAHKKDIVHRDLKLGNIMVVRDKEGGEVAKVMDFGIAKIAQGEQEAAAEGGGLYRTQEGIVTGTPQYMSPEQASGEKVDHRSDLYSLGVILFELLTGRLPFTSDTPMGFLGKHIVEPPPRPSAVSPRPIPEVLDEVTLKLLEKSPADRYQTAGEVLSDLELRASGEVLARSAAAAAALASSRRPPQPTVELDTSGSTSGARGFAPTIPLQPAARLDDTSDTPPPASDDLERRKLLVLGGLAGVLVLVITIATTLALALSGPDPSQEIAGALARGEALLSTDPAETVRLIAPLAEVHDEHEGLRELLARARDAVARKERAAHDARQQVEYADTLVAKFDQGTAGRDTAERAVQLYRDAQRLAFDPEVQARLERLEARLAAFGGAQSGAQTGVGGTGSAATTPEPTTASGEAELLRASRALDQGELEEAARLLEHAAGQLPADHAELVRLQAHLRAERLIVAGKAAQSGGRLGEAREKLEEARRLHPGGPRALAEIARLLEEVSAAEARLTRAGALTRELEAVLAAARVLDLSGARAALDRAAEAAGDASPPELARRREALEQLELLAPGWREARERVATLVDRGGAGDLPRARALLTSLRELRTPLEALASDPELQHVMQAALEEELTRATALVTRLEQAADQAKSEKLRRFERALAKLREQPEQRETYAAVGERLDELLRLRDFPSYIEGECSPEDRDWLDEQLARYERRRAVWDELGRDMVQIPGGAWTAPDGREHQLPATFYACDHEVTCLEWQAFLRATGRRRPPQFPGPIEEPVRFVSLADARAYCEWLGKGKRLVAFRLPEEGEWERAARGPEGTEFPWGAAFESWRAEHAAVGGRLLSRVRSFDKDKNGWGLWDVVGNVREMTATKDGGKLVLRGGAASEERARTGASTRVLVRPGEEVAGFVGLRVFASER